MKVRALALDGSSIVCGCCSGRSFFDGESQSAPEPHEPICCKMCRTLWNEGACEGKHHVGAVERFDFDSSSSGLGLDLATRTQHKNPERPAQLHSTFAHEIVSRHLRPEDARNVDAEGGVRLACKLQVMCLNFLCELSIQESVAVLRIRTSEVRMAV